MQGWGRIAGAFGVFFAFAAGCSDDEMQTRSDVMGWKGAECLEPPWTPLHSSFSNTRAKCEDSRKLGFVLGHGKVASEAQTNAFLDRYRNEAHDVSGIVGSGYGFCCEGSWPKPTEFCLVYTLRLCSTTVSSFVETLEMLQAKDREFANLSLSMTVELEGLTGPRCNPEEDQRCTALPYDIRPGDIAPEVPPPESRRPVRPLRDDAKACGHDGECVQNGCGNECDHWTDGNAAGTCPRYLELENAFCGCVSSQCAWFVGS